MTQKEFPQYVGTPKDVLEMSKHLLPVVKDKLLSGQVSEAIGIIKLQTTIVREIWGGEQTTHQDNGNTARTH